MRWLFVTLLVLSGAAARCEGIVEVLGRSQQLQLEAFTDADADAPSTRKVRQSFEALRDRAGLGLTVELRVVTGPVLAETLHGRVIIAHQSLGDLDEGARLFILAHELGHVSLKHWPQMTLLYQAWLPGELMQAQSDAVAALLGHDASALAHRQEFEADVFALHMLHALGRSTQDAVSAFVQMGVYSDTATHPGTRKRLAALRAAEGELK